MEKASARAVFTIGGGVGPTCLCKAWVYSSHGSLTTRRPLSSSTRRHNHWRHITAALQNRLHSFQKNCFLAWLLTSMQRLFGVSEDIILGDTIPSSRKQTSFSRQALSYIISWRHIPILVWHRGKHIMCVISERAMTFNGLNWVISGIPNPFFRLVKNNKMSRD